MKSHVGVSASSAKLYVSGVGEVASWKRREQEIMDGYGKRLQAIYEKRYALRHLFERQAMRLSEALYSVGISPERLEKMDVLEAAAGIGGLAVSLRPKTRRLFPFDISPYQTRVAHRLTEGRAWIGDCEAMAVADETFDLVILKRSLHHLRVPDAFVSEALRVLRPGGWLAIFEGDPTGLNKRLVNLMSRAVWFENESTQHRHLTPREIVKSLESKFSLMLQTPVVGFFSPLGILGWGGRWIWRLLDASEDLIQRACPHMFRYWNIFLAQKPDEDDLLNSNTISCESDVIYHG